MGVVIMRKLQSINMRSNMSRKKSGVSAPTFVSAETNEAGTVVTVEFDKEMADPSGKHAQFAVDDGAANAVTAAALNEDTTKIDLTLTNVIENGDTVTVSYTAGDVEAADGGVLGDFEAESVTNNVPVAGATVGYILSGYSGGVLQDTDEYDPDTWASKTSMPAPGRFESAATDISSKIYVICGHDGSSYIGDCDEYSPDTWASKTSTTGYSGNAASTISDKGYNYGGMRSDAATQCTEYSPDTWAAKTGMPNPGRYNLAAGTINNKGYLFCGMETSTYNAIKDCDEYSPDTWTSKTDTPDPARFTLWAFVLLSKAYIVGGYLSGGSSSSKDTDEYAPDTWTSKTDMPDPARAYLTAFNCDNNGYVAGGSMTGGDPVQDCDEYNVAGNSWTNKSDIPLPARYSSSAASI